MALPTYYATGTASVANGATTITFAGALLGTAEAPNLKPGDLFMDPAQPLVPPQRIASVNYDDSEATLAVGWPGTSMTADPYEVRFVDDITRSTAQTRRYLEMLGQLQALGLQPQAFGLIADRDEFDDQKAGFIFLDIGSPWTLYIKETDATADWDDGQAIEGAEGPQGTRGWAPMHALVVDGDRRVWQLVGYVGGTGDAPTANIGAYIGPTDYVADIGDATDTRGAAGADGTDPGVLLNWDDGTTDADPGAGNIRASHATWTSAAFLYISKTNRAGNDIAAALAAYGASTSTVKGALTLTRSGGNAQGGAEVTAVTDAIGYVKVAIAGNWGTSFLDGNAVSLQFDAKGDAGDGVGDVVGPSGAVNDRLAAFDGTSGKLLKDSGIGVDDIYTKSQTDTLVANAAAGVAQRGTVRVATTANITIATAINDGDSLDGVTLVTGDLVLVKNQSAAAENGVYVVGVSPARAAQFDTYNEHPGALIVVQEGTVNADTFWYCTSNAGGTLGATAITFAQMALTPADGSIANVKLANMANATVKGRSTAGTGAPEDLTIASLAALLVAANGVREKLTAARTYFVATNGSDGNSGLATATTGAATFTNGSANVGWTAHGRSVGDVVFLTTTGALPTNFTATQAYYVKTVVDPNTITVAPTAGGTAVSAGSAGTGTHTITLTSPFLTIQKAIDVAAMLDSSIYDITIMVGGGTYTLTTGILFKSMVGVGAVTIIGDTATPANVIIQADGNNIGAGLITTSGVLTTNYFIRGFTTGFTANGSVKSIFNAQSGRISVNNWVFGGASAPYAHMLSRGGYLQALTFTVSTGATYMARADNGGSSFIDLVGGTATMSGTPAWVAGCVSAALSGSAIVYGKTWTGSATGPRYAVAMNGAIDSAGGGASFLPGNAVGTAATGGQYG